MHHRGISFLGHHTAKIAARDNSGLVSAITFLGQNQQRWQDLVLRPYFLGTDHGNLVASRSTADARIGGATTVGRPTATVLTVPIVATLPEQDLIFASFENLTGGSLSDHFALRDAASVSGIINGAGGNDSIDYRDYTTSVLVDLFTGTATNINSSNAGGLFGGVGGDTDNSIENAIGGSAGDFIAGDNDDMLEMADAESARRRNQSEREGSRCRNATSIFLAGDPTASFRSSPGAGSRLPPSLPQALDPPTRVGVRCQGQRR